MSPADPTTKNTHLESLYPFLHGKVRDAKSMRAMMLDSTQQKIAHHQQTIEQFFAEHADEVVAAAETITNVYRNNGRLLCMGNGGSSCDAGHIAVEFLHPVTAGRPALPAIDLTADRAMMTAVGNDVGFGNIFVRQVIAHGRPGDGLVGISTSGNSENLIKAFQKAQEMGLATIGLAGINGGKMADQGLDHCLVVQTDSIHRIQECHLSIYHILWDLVHSLLADDRGNLNVTPGTNKLA